MTLQHKNGLAPLNRVLSVSLNNRLDIVLFSLGEQMYGLPVAYVLEILFMPSMLTLAGASPYVCGLLNRRGQHLPVIDGRLLLGETPKYGLSSKIVVVSDIDSPQNHRPSFGLLVDHVQDVCSVAVDDMTILSDKVATKYVAAVIPRPAGSVMLFDVAQLIQCYTNGKA